MHDIRVICDYGMDERYYDVAVPLVPAVGWQLAVGDPGTALITLCVVAIHYIPTSEDVAALLPPSLYIWVEPRQVMVRGRLKWGDAMEIEAKLEASGWLEYQSPELPTCDQITQE